MDRAIVLKFARPAKVPQIVNNKLVGMHSPISDETLLSALQKHLRPAFEQHFPDTEILIEVSGASKYLVKGFSGQQERDVKKQIPVLLENLMDDFSPAEE
ncbi:hypothetical protein [Deinococcus cellulosilyticus]|uniref:Uncharacterized protein n=1 Tax=Deinococcus cellulosilyticus (strain DSM 18568 / NBRC 106333 / KACC 11606 / 5516J-15) TaxID=1223518 RepID=A0A511NB89_DEIC1|nr:hypothetical protein [Deinococcus cellulosilyticus]GEM49788.1 hypothetical protein DC3_54230 [Deinococcus cellulosilyticus NBRC 106333 = KACC 11606]